jgi:hypothetical protein
MSTSGIIREAGDFLNQLDAALGDQNLTLAVSLLRVSRQLIETAENRQRESKSRHHETK